MRFGSDLREKAVLALEEAVQESRYRAPRRSFAIRFALAYLWSSGNGAEREPYRDFWRALAKDDIWRFAACDRALGDICRSLGIERDEGLYMAMWKRRHAEERRGRPVGEKTGEG